MQSENGVPGEIRAPVADTGAGKAQAAKKSGVLAVVLVGGVFGMMGLSFAAVPLYQKFCQVTGFGGTTQVAAAPAANVVLDRIVRVRFVANTDSALPWHFAPRQIELRVNVGAPAIAYFEAENNGVAPSAGRATFNVTPAKAGRYFNKVQCFCFDEQVLLPDQRADMPVTFFVDPAMADDPAMDDVTTITLSYTFFPSQSEAFERAADAYYKSVDHADADHGAGAGHATLGPET